VIPVTKDQDRCGTEVSIQTIQIQGAHGALRDAVVSVEGLPDKDEVVPIETTERSVLNMRCAFSPRVGTARKGQDVEIRNQDPILHNTHIKYGQRTFLNVAQVPGGKPIVKRLKRAGLHDIRCDKHVFMEGYLHVFSHPYYALTTQAGTFRITGIPAGKYPVHVWHETLGGLDQVVTIPENGTVRVDFAYP
jgi:plastocyanin